MRCGNCKHWNEQTKESYSNDWDAVRLRLGECNRIRMLCESTKFKKKDEPLEGNERRIPGDDEGDGTVLIEIDSTQKMYTQDGSSYRANLYTKPDFFCAHFEAKGDSFIYRIETAEKGEGYYTTTRAGDTLEQAWVVLASYRRNYPNARHRLVEAFTNGRVVPLVDDVQALNNAEEAANVDNKRTYYDKV